jgi:hypothetical protein
VSACCEVRGYDGPIEYVCHPQVHARAFSTAQVFKDAAIAQIEILFDKGLYACIIGPLKTDTDKSYNWVGMFFSVGFTGAIQSHIKVSPYI